MRPARRPLLESDAEPGSTRHGPDEPGRALADVTGAAGGARGHRAGWPADVPASFLRVVDVFVLLGAFWIAAELATALQGLLLPGTALGGFFEDLWVPSSAGGTEIRPYGRPLAVLLIVIPTVAAAMTALGGYRPLRLQSRTRVVASSVLAAFAGVSALTLVLFTFRVLHFSRSFVLLYGATAAAGFISYRLAVRAYKRQRAASGHYARQVAVVGDLRAVQWMLQFYREHASPTSYRVAGYFDVGIAEGAPVPPTIDGAERLGRIEDIGEVLIHRPIHEVVAVLGPSSARWIGPVADHCDYFGIVLRMVPQPLLSTSARNLRRMHFADDRRLPEIVLAPPHFGSDRLFFKRLIDLCASGVLLMLCLPLFLLIALAVKLTTPRLPVLYKWQVIGYKGQPFTGYKFTTMREGAEQERTNLLDRNEMTGPVFKIKDDPRVTPLGKVLRKYSLNELPQLWSVLRGDMSLVGPRPAFPHELERYELWHKRKLSVKPGITCLWQVRGRNRVSDFDEWVRMDLEYIDHWSLWLDFKILARTAWVVVAGTGS